MQAAGQITGLWPTSAYTNYARQNVARGNRHARAYRNAHVDQNKVPNNLLVNEPCRPRGSMAVAAGKMHTAALSQASLCPETVRGKPYSFRRPVRCRSRRLARRSSSNCAYSASSVRCFSSDPTRNHQPIVTSQCSKQVPNHLLVNEPSLSTQGIGGSCGR